MRVGVVGVRSVRGPVEGLLSYGLLSYGLLVHGLLSCELCDVLPHGRDVERSGQAQGPGERPALVGEVDAARVGVHAGPPARQTSGGVGGQPGRLVSDRDDAQQGWLGRLRPAAHTGAHRAR